MNTEVVARIPHSLGNPAAKWGLAVAALAWMLTASPVLARPDSVTNTRGRTWDSIKKLPDWSGVWVLSDDSWNEVTAAMTGHDDGRVPLTPKYMAIRAANGAANNGDGPPGGTVDNSERCIPAGTPGVGSLPLGHEYLYTPGRVTVIFEDGEIRRIDTQARNPGAVAPDPTFAGTSTGHWEGPALVVETVGIVPQAELFVGLRLAEDTHVRQRIFLKDRETLQIDTIVINPEMFTRPYSYTRLYQRSRKPPLEYVACNDNNRDRTVNGHQTDVDLTPPSGLSQPKRP